MGPFLLAVQVALCINLVYSDESPSAINFGDFQPTYQEIRGLPSNQQGFILTHPNFPQSNSGILSHEQQVQIKAQEDFRKAVAEANQKRINVGTFRASQEIPFVEIEKENPRVESIGQISTPDIEILEQQLPIQGEHIQQTSSSERFEALRTPEPELILPPQGNSNFNRKSLAQQFEAQKFKEQAENAKYFFKTAVADSINDNSHFRQESRDGLKLTGLYSYSDGYFKRTVHYIADENGYRVVKEESEPIGAGPQIDPSGRVDVSTQVAGSTLQYTIKGENLPPPIRNKHLRN